MNLERGEKARRRHAQLRRDAPAVFRDMRCIVLRADAAIEAFINSIGHAAVAGEERMTQARNGRKQRRSQRHDVSALLSGSAKPASVSSAGSEIDTTLNIDPMPPRPPSVRRFSAPEMS